MSKQVVILAAGMGTRLARPLPKPLTELRDGRSIMKQQMDNLAIAFADTFRVMIVVGFKLEAIIERFPEATFVYNEFYDQTNTSKSLLKALRASGDGGVLWLNGDVVFDPQVLVRVTPYMDGNQSFVVVNTSKVSDEEVKAHYDQHAKEFMSPDQVVIDYIELKKSAFFDQVKVTDEELKAQYEKEIANLAEQRHAAHILIEVNDKVTDAQAKARAEEIEQRLAKGEDFAALAKEFSQDPGSATSGGDLGFAGPGVYDPAFEEALYQLQNGQVSAPVRTEFGYHLIKLLGVQAPEVPSFASLKDKLTRDLKMPLVEQRYVDASKQLQDAAYEASDLAQPAQDLNLKVHTSAAFGREGGEGITANRAVVQAAFSEEVLDEGANSTAIELDPETTVVLRV